MCRNNMSRVEREAAIIRAVYAIENNGWGRLPTSYEICKRMGVTRQTRLYKMMLDMADRGLLQVEVLPHRRNTMKRVFWLTPEGRKTALAMYSYSLPVRSLRINGVEYYG